MNHDFLPVTWREMRECGWDAPDFVYVTGDAYVDHPSFGLAIISRVLERAGCAAAGAPELCAIVARGLRRRRPHQIGVMA